MLAIKIIRCSDPKYWYANKIGETLVYVATDMELPVYWSREPAGFANIVYRKDAELIEVPDGSNDKTAIN